MEVPLRVIKKSSSAIMTKVSQANGLGQRRTSIVDKSSLSQAKWNCMYYIVLISKYRRRTMYGKIRKDVREIIKSFVSIKELKL